MILRSRRSTHKVVSQPLDFAAAVQSHGPMHSWHGSPTWKDDLARIRV